MKRKVVTVALLALLTIGAVTPMVAKASTTWNYGYNSSEMCWYNDYYNSDRNHFAQTLIDGTYFTSGTASAGGWACVSVDYFGPYQAYYYAYDV